MNQYPENAWLPFSSLGPYIRLGRNILACQMPRFTSTTPAVATVGSVSQPQTAHGEGRFSSGSAPAPASMSNRTSDPISSELGLGLASFFVQCKWVSGYERALLYLPPLPYDFVGRGNLRRCSGADLNRKVALLAPAVQLPPHYTLNYTACWPGAGVSLAVLF